MKKNMIKLIKSSLLLMFALVCSSCLKGNLDDLPAFEEAIKNGLLCTNQRWKT